MPAIEITDSKGLIQVTGTGVTSTSSVTVSGATTLSGALTLNSNFAPKKAYDRYYLEESFVKTPGINGDLASTSEATRVPRNKNFEVGGANATSALATFDHDYSGITLTTDTADNDAMIIIPHLDTKQSAWAVAGMWDTQNEVEWTAAFTTGAAITNVGIWAGLKLTNTPVYATDTDQIYFIYDTSEDSGAITTNANLHVVHSIGGVDRITNLGIAVAVNTTYHLKIAIAADRTATVFVDGTQYSLTTATTAGGVLTGAGTAASAALTTNKPFIPYIALINRSAAARVLRVHNEKISRKIA